MSFSFRVRGAEIVRTALNKATLAVKGGFDRDTAFDILHHLLSNTPPYPPERQGQQYRRTYNLAAALESEVGEHEMSLSEMRAIGGSQAVVIGLKGGSERLYGSEVVGFPEQQKPIHRGRWWTLFSYVESQMGNVVRIVRKGTSRMLRRIGL